MRRNVIVVTATMLAIFAAALPVLAANGTLSGVVRLQAAGTPVVSGALVRTEGEPTYSATTATDGSYSFSAPAGTYNVMVSAAGCVPQRNSQAVTGGTTTTLNLSLRQPGVSGMVVDLPAPLEWGEPASAPTPPGDDFPVVFSNLGATPDPAAPQISEWHETVKPDESFTMTGARFTSRTGSDAGTDTIVWIWARTSTGGTLRQAQIWKVQDNVLTALIPSDLPFGMYLVWVENSVGASLPVCINRTTPRWIGPLGNTASPGDTKRVFGFNMSYGHGTATSYVYLQPTSGGAFTPCTVTNVEPSAVSFLVPSNTPVGTYRVFTHNGHGGAFGWGDALTLTVQSPWVRGSTEQTVFPSGGDDRANLQSAIDAMSNLSTGGTVRLVAGTYKTYDQLWIKSKVRLVGAGMDVTNIELRGTIAGRHDYVRVWGSNIQVEGLTFIAKLDSATPPVYGILEGPYPEHDWSEADNIKYVNVRLTGDIGTILTQNGLGYSRIEVSGCSFDREIDAGSIDGWMHDTNLYGGPYGYYQASPYIYFETEAGFSLGSRVVFENTHLETKNWPYDASKPNPYNYYDNMTAEQYAYKIWCKRVFAPQFGASDSYTGHLTTKDVAVQDNKGEMCLFHGLGGQWFGEVLSASGLTLNLRTDGTVNGAVANIQDYGANGSGGLNGGQPVPDGLPSWLSTDGGYAIVIAGKGLGQARQIVSHSTTSVTVDKPWRVQLDSTSRIICSHLYIGHMLYQNDFNAFPAGYAEDKNYSASRGWDIDGNGWKIQAELNTSHRNWLGRSIYANSGGPSYWCVARGDNAADCADCGMNISNWEQNPMGPILLGDAFRSCQNNIFGDTDYYNGFGGYSGQGTGCMIENCSTSGGGLGYTLPVINSGGYSSGGWSDGMVLYRKGNISVAKVASNPKNPMPVFVYATDKKQYLIGNTYSGGSPTYTYNSVAAQYILLPEYRVARFKGYPGETLSNIVVPIANGGTTSSSWSVGTPSQTWITATKISSGNIAAEAETGQVRISVSTSGQPASKQWGYVPITMGSQTVRIGVSLDLTSPVPTTNMKLWLRPNAGITQDGNGYVSSWLDQSGSGNNLAQSTQSSEPLYVAGSANGQGAVRFAGSDDLLKTAGLVVTTTSQFTIYAYAKPSSVTPPQTLFWQGDGSSTGGYGAYFSGNSNLKTGWGSSSGEVASTNPATAGNWSLIESRYDSSTHKMWINGTLSGSVSKTNSNFTTGYFTLGNYGPTPTQGFIGDVAEVLVYGRALSDAERASVQSYLKTKYGKPTAQISTTPTVGLVPLAVAFDGSASSAPGGSIVSYTWSFGDGGSATGVTTSHTFNSAGSYTVSLTVTDGDGIAAPATTAVTVYPPVTAASISGSPTGTVGAGSDVNLTAGATGGYQVLYRFLANGGSGWQVVRDYLADNICTWTPSAAGNYTVKVQAKSTASANDFDAESTVLSYTVSQLPTGMVLWMNAEAGVSIGAGNAVSAWADQSATAANFSQSFAPYKPIYMPYAVNKKPALRFSGSGCGLQSGSTILSGATSFTTFTVARTSVALPLNYEYFWWAGTDSISGGYGTTVTMSGTIKTSWGSGSGGVSSQLITAGTWYQFASRFNPPSHDVWMNGTAIGHGNKTNSNLSGGFSIGNYAPSAAYQGLTGDIAEIIVYGRSLTDLEMQAVEGYLADKWTPAPATNVDRINSVKSLADGTLVAITSPKIVVNDPSIFADGSYYIEEPDRTAGIKVIGGSVSLWDNVTLTGIVVTDANGERVLNTEHIDTKTPGSLLGPLGMLNKSVTPTGSVVRAWGTVTSSGPQSFTFTDGSGTPVTATFDTMPVWPSVPNAGDYVAVTGIACRDTGGVTVLRPRSADDVTIVEPAAMP